MEDEEASAILDGKELGNLRVVDLKQELEKRGLSKSGSKKDLVKRLKLQVKFEKVCEERKSTEVSQELNEEQVSPDKSTVSNSSESSEDNINDRRENNQRSELLKAEPDRKSNDEHLQVSSTDVKLYSASEYSEIKDSALNIKISVVNKQASKRGSSMEISKHRLCASEKVYEHLQVPISPVDSSETINEPIKVSESSSGVSENEYNLPETSKYSFEGPQNVYEQSNVPKSPIAVAENVYELGKISKSSTAVPKNNSIQHKISISSDIPIIIDEQSTNSKSLPDIVENVYELPMSSKSPVHMYEHPQILKCLENPENENKPLKAPKSPVDNSYDLNIEHNSSSGISKIPDRAEYCDSNISSVNPLENINSAQNIPSVIKSSDSRCNKSESFVYSSHISNCRADFDNPPSADNLQDVKSNKIKIIIRRNYSEKEIGAAAENSDDNSKSDKTLANVQHFEETESIPSGKVHSCDSATSETKSTTPNTDSPMTEKISFGHTCKQDTVSNMEPSQISSVPYSLSDIKLPESPEIFPSKSSKTVKIDDNSSKMDSSDNEAAGSSLEDKVKSNGVSEADTVSHHGETSDSESNKSDDLSEENQKRKEKYDTSDKLKNKSSSRQSMRSESSSEETVKTKIQPGEKTSKYKDKSPVDTEEQSKSGVDRKQKVKRQSDDSENESHSDAELSHMNSRQRSVDRKSKSSRQHSDDSENEKSVGSRHKSKSKSDRRRKYSRQYSEERDKSYESKYKSKDNVDKKKYSRQQSEDRDNEKNLDSRHKSKDKTDRRQKSSRHHSEDRENEKSLDSRNRSKDRGQKSSKQKSEDKESEESLELKHKDKMQQSEDRDNDKILDLKHKKQQSDDKDNEKNTDLRHKSKDRDRRQQSEDEDKSLSSKHKSKYADRRQLSEEDKQRKGADSKHKAKDTGRKLQSEDRHNEKSLDLKHKSNLNVGRRQISRQQFENSEHESSGDDEHKHMDSKSNDYLNTRQQTLKQQSDVRENEKNSDTEKETSCNDSKNESEDNKDRCLKDLKPQSESESESLGIEKNKVDGSVVHRSKSPKQHLEDSENEKSSDSENLSSHVDSKHKLPDSPQVLRQRSHSQSSSSSHSSDSSSKRRRSKKSLVSKNSNFENDESNQMSDINLAQNPKEDENVDKPKQSSRKRIKIKRDNISVENVSSSVESGKKFATNKSVEKPEMSSSHSVSEKSPIPESTELQSHEIPYVPRKVSLSNRKLNRNSSDDSSAEPKAKRNKWGSFAASQKTSQSISISTDSVKNWFPDFKLICEPTTPMELEPEESQFLPSIEERAHSSHVDPFDGNDSGVKQASTSQMSAEDGELLEPSMEELSEQGPVSKIIFIQNLVRPFTLSQLKNLLKQNGKIVEEFFWIDKIKSKCFVMYETEKEACKARNALNNTRWPPSNPKILSVEFSNEEECEQHKKGNEPPPKAVAEPIVEPPEMIETRDHQVDEPRRKDRDRRKERERSKPQLPIREWDKDKIIQESPERGLTKEEKPRSSEKDKKKESKKRPNEDTSAKLLDHLFQKTKSAPCIYWLPLTEEQAKQKEEAKKLRKMEREKHNQMKEQEEAERRNRRARSSRRSREKENRKSSTRSRSPVPRRR